MKAKKVKPQKTRIPREDVWKRIRDLEEENADLRKRNINLNNLLDQHKALNLFKAKRLFEYRQKIATVAQVLGIELASIDPGKLDLFIIETEEIVKKLTKKIRAFGRGGE